MNENGDVNERLKLLFQTDHIKRPLQILNVYKNDTDKLLKAGDEISIDLATNLLFDYKLNVPLARLQDEYKEYFRIRYANSKSGDNAVKYQSDSNFESLYSSAYEVNIFPKFVINGNSTGTKKCGEKYLVEKKKRYLFS